MKENYGTINLWIVNLWMKRASILILHTGNLRRICWKIKTFDGAKNEIVWSCEWFDSISRETKQCVKSCAFWRWSGCYSKLTLLAVRFFFLCQRIGWSIILLHVSAFSIVFSYLLSLIGLDDTHCPIELGPRMRRQNIYYLIKLIFLANSSIVCFAHWELYFSHTVPRYFDQVWMQEHLAITQV